MENQKERPPPPETAAASAPPPQSKRDSGGHISLSSPPGSPHSSLHSKHSSSEHISLSSPVGNSPARSSAASEHITINHSCGSSPELEKNRLPEKKLQGRSSIDSEYITFDHRRGSSPEKEEPHSPPPAVVVRKDVYKGPAEDRIVVEPMAMVNRAVMEEPKPVAPKTDSAPEAAGGGVSKRRRTSPSLSILKRSEREKMVRKAALGFRVFGFLFCLVSFAVMAADRNQGWALDSFDRYKEFRYRNS